MATPEVAVGTGPATGQSFECWLSQTLSASGTGSFFRSMHSHVVPEFNAVPAGSLLIFTGSDAALPEPVLTLTCSPILSAEPLSVFTGSYAASVDLDSLASLVAYRRCITDPEAGFRLREPELLNWTKNLHDLNAVTGVILPGIRELTEPEQRNLRGVYQKLYRKA